MVALNPAPATLGLASPALGPWFATSVTTDTLPRLALPGADLSVTVSLLRQMQVLAPAGCTVSYFISTSPRPPALMRLRQVDGTPAFGPESNKLIVLLTLLPEVELRLAALSNAIVLPNTRNAGAGQPGRPAVRHLALEISGTTASSMSAIESLRATSFPAELTTPEEKAEYLGLAINADGTLANARKPIAELHRPNFPSAVILQNGTAADLSIKLWAFDDRGRPLDPGAVACWWSHLASGTPNAADPLFSNLWASNQAAQQITAAVTGGFTVEFTSPHEGPVSPTYLNLLELTATNSNGFTPVDATAASPTLFSVAAPATITLTGTPTTMPIGEIALLPAQAYAAPAGVFAGWISGTAPWNTTLTRDFARVGVLDIEADLVGLTRSDPVQADNDLRVAAMRNTAPNPFLATADAAANQVMVSLAAGPNAVAMAPAMDANWGALAPAGFAAATGAVPSLTFSVHALRGEAEPDGATVAEQRIVVRFPSLPANSWVRVWPHGLDTGTGQRFRLDGGGGQTGTNGQAYVVIKLPDGTAGERLSFDAMIVVGTTATFFLEQRFDRPAPVDGDPEPLPPGSGLIAWMCEQGAAFTPGVNALGGGVTLLAIPFDMDGGIYALCDRGDLVAADMAASVLQNALGANDRLIITEPAFKDGEEGDITGPPVPAGAALLRRTRSLLADTAFDSTAPVTGVTLMGRPLPSMERREVFAIDPATAGSPTPLTGVVAALSGRAAHHEFAPAMLGHPGAPAAPEIHGTGVALAGPITNELVELARERAASNIAQFVAAAASPITQAAGAGPSTYAAVLETLTHGVTGDGIVRGILAAGAFEPGQPWVDFKNSIEASLGGINIDPVIDPRVADDTLAAALDRVFRKTRDGAVQGATSLVAAIGRAEDLIYIETPAIDALVAGTGTGRIDLVGALEARLAERPSLVLLLCVPERFLPGTPTKLEAVRKAGIDAALQRLLAAAPDRVIPFTPTAGPGRPLHMASTTIIVDDAYLLAGTTHLWRRGLTFDSSLAVALFDEALTLGRPTAVIGARRQLIADRLGIAVNLVPDDPAHMLEAIRRLVAAGGLLRLVPNAYTGVSSAAPPSPTDLIVWNPDGRPGTGYVDGFVVLAGVITAGGVDINNAIR